MRTWSLTFWMVVWIGGTAACTEIEMNDAGQMEDDAGPGGTAHAVDLRGHDEWILDDDGLIAESRGHFDEQEYARLVGGGVAG